MNNNGSKQFEDYEQANLDYFYKGKRNWYTEWAVRAQSMVEMLNDIAKRLKD